MDLKLVKKNNLPPYYSAESFEKTGLVRHGFSTRLGGVSTGYFSSLNLGVSNKDDSEENVLKNYELFCSAVGCDYKRLVLTNQVHDDKIYTVTGKDCGKGVTQKSDILGIDGLITNEKNVPVAVFFADCTPFLFLDPVKKVICSVHSGWKGTLLRIGSKGVKRMISEFNCNPDDILVAIGPNIKQCHFEVDDEVYSQFVNEFGDDCINNSYKHEDKYHIDTNAINIKTLLELGIRCENISVSKKCTVCDKNMLFSHRGDNGKTGRMCAVIELI